MSGKRGAFVERDGKARRGTSLRRSMFGFLAFPVDGLVKLAENIAKCIDATAVSASFDGVEVDPSDVRKVIRESVLEGFQAADVHRTWLAELDRVARNSDDLDALKNAVSAYIRQAGIERVEDVERPELYRAVGVAHGDEVKIVQPAYVDKRSGGLILVGHIQYVPATKSDVASAKKA